MLLNNLLQVLTSRRSYIYFWTSYDRYVSIVVTTITLTFPRMSPWKLNKSLCLINTNNTLDALCGERFAYHSGAHAMSGVYDGVNNAQYFNCLDYVLYTVVCLIGCCVCHGIVFFFDKWLWLSLWYLSPLFHDVQLSHKKF